MRKLLLIALFLPFVFSTSAQTKLLEKEVPESFDDGIWGANLRHYGHFFIGIGALPEFDGSKIYNNFVSSNMKFGYRYKLKIFNFYALGAEANVGRLSYRLKEEQYTYNDPRHSDEWDSQVMRFLTVGGNLYQRINFDRRGNFLGKYLDLGVSANYIYSSRNIYTYSPSDPSASKVKVKEKGIASVQNDYWGVFARIGSNKLALTFNYRMSEIMSEIMKDIMKDTPVFEPYQIGIEIGF